MSGHEYAEFPPHGTLATIVNCVWTYDDADGTADQPIVPDGRCELVVHCGAPYLEYSGNDAEPVRQVPLLFAGQMTRPLTLRPAGPVSVVALRFTPTGAWPFLRRSLAEFTDRRVDLTAVFGAAAKRLLDEIRMADPHVRLDILQNFVAAKAGARPPLRDEIVERCVSLIYANSATSLESVRDATKLSARTLQRRFATAVGVSPRTLTAIVRFRRVFASLQCSDAKNWTEAAHAAGYYDLPQLDRDFRRFTGFPPSEFLRAGPGLARSLVSL